MDLQTVGRCPVGGLLKAKVCPLLCLLKALQHEQQAQPLSTTQALAELQKLSEDSKAFFEPNKAAAILKPEAKANLKHLLQACPGSEEVNKILPVASTLDLLWLLV